MLLTMNRLFALIICAIIMLPLSVQAQHYTNNWRQDALEMIEDGRLSAARLLLDEAASREPMISKPIERINQGRFLGEAFAKLGKKDLSREHFNNAMDAALQLKPVWRSLSAVISVLELQAGVDDIENSWQLLQKSLDAKLLPNMAKDHYATEIGRYVKRFALAKRAQVYVLLKQLRSIDNERVRKKAFFALTELEFSPFTGEGKYEQMSIPLGMKDFERFLWFSVMAKYYAASGQSFVFKQQVNAMQKAYDRIGEERQQKYRKIYRMVKKLSYKAPKKVEMADPKPKSSDATDLKSHKIDENNGGDMRKLIYGE